MVLLQRKLYFPKDPEGGSNIFQGGPKKSPSGSAHGELEDTCIPVQTVTPC